MEIFRDRFYKLEQHTISPTEDIFATILAEREKNNMDRIDRDRFFLEFFPKEIFSQYDFSNPNSVESFSNICYTIDSPLMRMGGYNMDPKYLQEDIRYAGVKMSDPYGKIYGSFDIRNGIITYNPLFPHFYEERDLIKFANDTYFTTMTFEDIMMQQIASAESYYLNIGQYHHVRDIIKKGYNILEKVSQEQMTEFVFNPEAGAKVYKRTIR